MSAEQPGEVPAPSRSIGRASALLASGTLVSRILGFISAFVLAQTIGTQGAGADSFILANQLPNNIYAIIAGGMLSAVIVPQIVRAGLHDDGGQRFTNRLVTLGIVVFLAVTAIATACAPLLVRLYAAAGFDDQQLALATAFAYWTLPQILFYALYALFGEVLNARGVFGPFTWAPAVNNVIMIAGLFAFQLLFGPAGSLDAGQWTPERIALLAGGATLGIAAQAVILIWFWRRAGLRYRPEFRWRGVGLGTAGRTAAWTFGMILVTQAAGVVDARVASLATGDASIATMHYGWLIFMLPHSIIAVSIGVAYFTRMSGHARDGDLTALRDDVSTSLRAILLLLTFAAIGLMVLAFPIAAVFGQDYAEVRSLALVLVVYLVGLLASSAIYVLQRVFFSLEDTRTPFFLQCLQALTFVVLALVVASWPVPMIALGLAGAITVAVVVQTAVGFVVLHRRLGGIALGLIAVRTLWFHGAMVPAAASGIGVLCLLGGVGEGAFPVSGIGGAIVSGVLAGTVMLVVYAAALAVSRNPEFLAFARPVLARLRR